MLTKKQGRPSKLTEDRVKILSECFRSGMTTNIACDFANISRDTFYSWYEKHESFRTLMNYSRAFAAKKLLKRIQEKDPWKLLKNIYRGEYVDEPIVQVNVQERPYAHLSTEELLKLEEDLKQIETESSDEQ